MIDLVFQIINLGIVVGLALYIFRYMMMPDVRTKFEQEQLIKQNLHDEHSQLIFSQKALETSLEAQAIECTVLKKKIDQWKETVINRIQSEDREKKGLFIALEKKLELQSYNHALKARQKELAPAIVGTLERELKEYFSQPDKASEYMRSAIEQLKVSP